MRTWMLLVAIGGIAGCGLIANIESVRYESDSGQEAGPGNQGDGGEVVKDAGARDATDWRTSTGFCGHFDAAKTYFCSDFELGADVEDEGWTRNAPTREAIAFADGHGPSRHAPWFYRAANTTAPVTMSWSTSLDQTGRSTFMDMSVLVPAEVPDDTVWGQFEPSSSSGCALQFVATGVRLTPSGTVLPFAQPLPRTEPAHLYVTLGSTGSGDDQLSVELKERPTTTFLISRQTIPCKNRGVSVMSFGVHGNDAHGADRSVNIDNVAIGVP